GATCRDWRRVARWSALPRWLRDLSQEGDVLARVARVGWVNRATGEVHEARWQFGFERDESGWVVWFRRLASVDDNGRGAPGAEACSMASVVSAEFVAGAGSRPGFECEVAAG